jgi:hypothetical protein
LLAAGCPNSGSLPVITSFTATPDTISAGAASTLAWTVTNASQVSIDQGVGVQTGSSVVVTPAVTTTYTLTATGPGGSTTAFKTVSVTGVLAKPVITAFTASPDDVAAGSQSVLTWTVTGTVTSLTMNDGLHPVKDVTGTSSLAVTPDTVTTYTLTATNAGGSDSASRKVSVHSASLRLQYTDPTSITAKILVVKNAASTTNRLVLDVKVGALPITAFGFAMNIPLQIVVANPVVNGIALDANLTPPGLIPGTINIGSSPATGAVMVGGPAMSNFISVGVAKHKSAVGDGDDAWAAGSTLFSFVIKMVGSPAKGNVFLGSQLATDPTFRAAALTKNLNPACVPDSNPLTCYEAVHKADIALGDFIISL